MENLNTIDTLALIDLLLEQTAKYTLMNVEGGNREEYERCKLIISAIQKEIEARRQAFGDNSTASTVLPDFVS